MAHIRNVVLGAVISACCVAACGGDDDKYVRPPGRGSAACQAWQKSVCDYVALDCNAMSERDCVANYYGVTCTSDTTARSCSAALDNAACGAAPSGCDLFDMADPAPAVTACNAFIDATCQHFVSCGSATLDACRATASASLDCSKAVAYAPSYESCLSDTAEQSCNASDPLASCKGVIKLKP
jgi:hypothetical protein